MVASASTNLGSLVTRFSSARRALVCAACAVVVAPIGACSAPRADFDPSHPLTILVQRGIATGSERFDHAQLDALLSAHVQADGRVDYRALADRRSELRDYLDRLAAAPLERMARDELMALLINAYNACTIDLVLEHYPLQSIRDLDRPWQRERCRLGGERVSLDFIEHQLLRAPQLFGGEPRIHFAVNCASVGCPPLRAGAYRGLDLARQLDEATRLSLSLPVHLQVDGTSVRVTQILHWFRPDFVAAHGSVVAFLRLYAPAGLHTALDTVEDGQLSTLPYDWSLNDRLP